MILYLDTSAVVPLLVPEPASAQCLRLWERATTVVFSRLLQVDAAAALHQANRHGRLTVDQLGEALRRLGELRDDVDIVEVDQELVDRAAELAGRHSLRGYDAVHCAAGLAVAADPDALLAAGDRALLGAWHREGAATTNVTVP